MPSFLGVTIKGLVTMDNKKILDRMAASIRLISPAQLSAHGILTAVKEDEYVCPFCGNGSGEDGTGMQMSLSPDGTNYIGHCFSSIH